MRRWLLVLVLAFGWLFSTPAQATPLVTDNTIRFSYTWGSYALTFTDSVVTVTVANDVTNKIGGNGEVIDTYRLTFANQVIEVTEKHGPRDYTFTGSGTLVLEGIDRGFWAGHYGPVMTVSVSPIALPEEPTTQSPQTESPTQSDASESPSLPSESAPVEAQTQSSESQVSSQSPSPESTPQAQPSPEPQPSPQPTYESLPTPEPIQPQPTPEPTPSETPTASSPSQSPEPEPTESPIVPSEPPTQSTVTPQPTPQATTSPEPQPSPIIEPSPIQSSEVIIEEPATTATEVTEITEEAFGSSLSEAIQASVTQAIGAVTEAVGELVEAFATAGLDMTPEQREEAQDVVVSTVMASQVAAGIRKIK